MVPEWQLMFRGCSARNKVGNSRGGLSGRPLSTRRMVEGIGGWIGAA